MQENRKRRKSKEKKIEKTRETEIRKERNRKENDQEIILFYYVLSFLITQISQFFKK